MIKPLKNRKWKVVSSEYVAREGDWFTVRRECVELPDGTRVPNWYIFEFPTWINVIAVTCEGEFVMINQYRHGIGLTMWELCAGVVDASDASPLAGAQRELLEETGFGGGRWSEFMCLSPNPTNHNNLCYTFLAEDVERIDAPHTEPSEDIEVSLMSADDVRQLLETGDIIQALHAAPLWKYFAEKHLI